VESCYLSGTDRPICYVFDRPINSQIIYTRTAAHRLQRQSVVVIEWDDRFLCFNVFSGYKMTVALVFITLAVRIKAGAHYPYVDPYVRPVRTGVFLHVSYVLAVCTGL